MDEIADLARAAFGHGRIISRHRLRELNALQDPVRLTVTDALSSVARVDCSRIEGDMVVSIRNGSEKRRSAYSVLQQVCGMIATYIQKGFDFLLEKSAELGKEAFKVYKSLERRVEDCLALLPALIECDTRWRCVLPQQRERVHDVLVRASAKGLLVGQTSPELVQRVQAWIH